MMGFGWIILVLIIAGFYFVFQNSHSTKRDTENESAIDILKKKYACGDITKEEFEKRKSILL
jgi:putative membrane protein